MRPSLKAIASQEGQLNWLTKRVASLEAQISELARLAGVEAHLSKLVVRADADNPAQPWPSPAAQAPEDTSDNAVSPGSPFPVDNMAPGGGNQAGTTELQTPGGVSGMTDVAPATTTTVDSIGADLTTPAYAEDQDVTAPVAGTETRSPIEDVRTEVDVRVGQGDNSPAFPIEPDGGFTEQMSTQNLASIQRRTMASIRLARLRIAAGISNDDEFGLAEVISASKLSNEAIEHEIDTIERVRTASSRRPSNDRRNLVPRIGSNAGTTIDAATAVSIPEPQLAYSPDAGEFLFE